MNRKPPINPKYIQVGPKLPCGMKNAPIIPPNRMRNLIPQNPFCIGALGSLEDFTPIINRDIKRKNRVTINPIRYTAKYPTKSSHLTCSLTFKIFWDYLHNNVQKYINAVIILNPLYIK